MQPSSPKAVVGASPSLLAVLGYSWAMRMISMLPLILAACGGGGGSAVPPATAPSARLEAQPIEIGTTMTVADVTVALAQRPEPAPALLQARVTLPPELTLPAQDRLAPATPLVTLEGNLVGGDFLIVCGDASNQNAAPLPNGALFRLRVAPSVPRTPGTYTLTLRDLKAATIEGDDVPLVADAVTVAVTIR